MSNENKNYNGDDFLIAIRMINKEIENDPRYNLTNYPHLEYDVYGNIRRKKTFGEKWLRSFLLLIVTSLLVRLIYLLIQ